MIKTDDLQINCNCLRKDFMSIDRRIDETARSMAAEIGVSCFAQGLCEAVAVRVLVRALALSYGAWQLGQVERGKPDVTVADAQLLVMVEEEIVKTRGSDEFRAALAELK